MKLDVLEERKQYIKHVISDPEIYKQQTARTLQTLKAFHMKNWNGDYWLYHKTKIVYDLLLELKPNALK